MPQAANMFVQGQTTTLNFYNEELAGFRNVYREKYVGFWVQNTASVVPKTARPALMAELSV